jgi:hypothetical protein
MVETVPGRITPSGPRTLTLDAHVVANFAVLDISIPTVFSSPQGIGRPDPVALPLRWLIGSCKLKGPAKSRGMQAAGEILQRFIR